MDDLISRQTAIDAILECCPSDCANEYECGYDDGLRNGVHKLKNLPSAQAEQRWIPVEDEPPKEKKTYWVCTDTGYQCECRWTNNVYGFRDLDEWGWSIFDIPQYTKVVAYMPLPKPWKGEEE